MSVILERIGYLLENMSQSHLSNITGIPKSTLSYVVNEVRELPTKYENVLYNTYRKQAYNRLRDAGASIVEANRFKSGSVARVHSVEKLYDQMVTWSKESAVDDFLLRKGYSVTQEELTAYEDYMDYRVRLGYRNSDNQTETIVRYLQREGFEYEDEMFEY